MPISERNGLEPAEVADAFKTYRFRDWLASVWSRDVEVAIRTTGLLCRSPDHRTRTSVNDISASKLLTFVNGENSTRRNWLDLELEPNRTEPNPISSAWIDSSAAW
jgi:hypothetical protein